MLPFGSITSIIPLFVLAFAYLLFFSASALNKTKTGDTEQKPSHSIEIELVDTQYNTVDFRDISPDTDAIATESQIADLPDRTESLPPGIPVRIFLQPFCGSLFSPRPPPSIFLQA